MTDPKQKKQLIVLSVLLVGLASALYYAFTMSSSTQTSVSPSAKGSVDTSLVDFRDLTVKRNPRRTGGKREMFLRDIDPTIHLEKLAEFDPGTPLNARNMFSLQAPPVTQVAERPRSVRSIASPGQGGENSGLAPSSGRAPGPPPGATNLKFFGIQLDPVQKKRHGFFAEGDAVYLAGEGELVANRYRVVRIGDSSAEIEEVSSKTRRQISLATP